MSCFEICSKHFYDSNIECKEYRPPTGSDENATKKTKHEIQYWLGFISDMNLWTNRTYLFIMADRVFFSVFIDLGTDPKIYCTHVIGKACLNNVILSIFRRSAYAVRLLLQGVTKFESSKVRKFESSKVQN